MINEDKIKLMTKIAMLEKKDGKAMDSVNQYFKSDYISVHLLRGFFLYTISFCLGGGVWALYSIDNLLSLAADMDALSQLGIRIVILYVAGLVIYGLITSVVYAGRYDRRNQEVKYYISQLKRLNKRYEFQSKSKELAKEGGHYDGTSRI